MKKFLLFIISLYQYIIQNLLNILFVKKILNFQITEFFSIISYKYKIDPK
mgnify:CR=1 FL=1